MIDENTLHNLLISRRGVNVNMAQQSFVLDAKGALFWPKHDLLIFSDLHFEKASYLSQFNTPIPMLDTQDTLARMNVLCNQYKPLQVICLGDSLHDEYASERMFAADLHSLNELISNTASWTWILGNHDPDVPEAIQGTRANTLVIDNILFSHEPRQLLEDDGVNAQIVGHYHPKTTIQVARHKVTGKCFVNDESLMIMPAFGSYTGGLDCHSPVIRDLFEYKTRHHLCSNGKVYSF